MGFAVFTKIPGKQVGKSIAPDKLILAVDLTDRAVDGFNQFLSGVDQVRDRAE
jgi:hypothetical protein